MAVFTLLKMDLDCVYKTGLGCVWSPQNTSWLCLCSKTSPDCVCVSTTRSWLCFHSPKEKTELPWVQPSGAQFALKPTVSPQKSEPNCSGPDFMGKLSLFLNAKVHNKDTHRGWIHFLSAYEFRAKPTPGWTGHMLWLLGISFDYYITPEHATTN